MLQKYLSSNQITIHLNQSFLSKQHIKISLIAAPDSNPYLLVSSLLESSINSDMFQLNKQKLIPVFYLIKQFVIYNGLQWILLHPILH